MAASATAKARLLPIGVVVENLKGLQLCDVNLEGKRHVPKAELAKAIMALRSTGTAIWKEVVARRKGCNLPMPPSVKGNMGEAIVEALAIECVAEKKFSEFFFESSELLKIHASLAHVKWNCSRRRLTVRPAWSFLRPLNIIAMEDLQIAMELGVSIVLTDHLKKDTLSRDAQRRLFKSQTEDSP